MESVILAALIVAGLTSLLTKATLFEPIRQWPKTRAMAYPAGTPGFKRWWLLLELFNCSFCLSHWAGFVAVALVAASWHSAATLYFPAVWIGNLAMLLSHLLSTTGQTISAFGLHQQVQADQIRMSAQARASQGQKVA